ncbi:MAG: LapA family protein [Sphingobacteriaceae bacterium]|nr:LapA family protein [Sphingobacteriaceae bacterium]
MSAKTFLIIIITFLSTLFLVSNTDAVSFNFLITDVKVSKLFVIGSGLLIGFILGLIVGRSKAKSTYLNDEESSKELSDDDRDYIS